MFLKYLHLLLNIFHVCKETHLRAVKKLNIKFNVGRRIQVNVPKINYTLARSSNPVLNEHNSQLYINFYYLLTRTQRMCILYKFSIHI